MKLNEKSFALTCGILWGISVLLMTWLLLAIGSPGKLISKMNYFYVGYSYSWAGGIVGLLWGFVDGFICGWIFAWLYNKLNKQPAA